MRDRLRSPASLILTSSPPSRPRHPIRWRRYQEQEITEGNPRQEEPEKRNAAHCMRKRPPPKPACRRKSHPSQAACLTRLPHLREITLDFPSGCLLNALPRWVALLRNNLTRLTLYIAHELNKTVLESACRATRAARTPPSPRSCRTRRNLESLSITTVETPGRSPPRPLPFLWSLALDAHFPPAPDAPTASTVLSAILLHLSAPSLSSLILKFPGAGAGAVCAIGAVGGRGVRARFGHAADAPTDALQRSPCALHSSISPPHVHRRRAPRARASRPALMARLRTVASGGRMWTSAHSLVRHGINSSRQALLTIFSALGNNAPTTNRHKIYTWIDLVRILRQSDDLGELMLGKCARDRDNGMGSADITGAGSGESECLGARE
ncbi:hypothetical protein FB451DRAFT_1180716 [Mycena latifolia]|nr:hypothetical protein FB451DRAFT_1180716 [Mycena latifolia]